MSFLCFSLFFGMNYIDWSITNFFGTLGTPPIEAPLATPSRKIKIIVLPHGLPFQFIYVRVELWVNYMGIEVTCYWERPKEQLENLRNSMGTYWERGGKKILLTLLPKRKKLDPSWVYVKSSRLLHETFISKTICHHFWIGLVAGAQIVGRSTTMVHKSIPLKRFLIFHFLHKMPIHMVDTPLKTQALFSLSFPTFLWRSSTQWLLLWWIFAIL